MKTEKELLKDALFALDNAQMFAPCPLYAETASELRTYLNAENKTFSELADDFLDKLPSRLAMLKG